MESRGYRFTLFPIHMGGKVRKGCEEWSRVRHCLIILALHSMSRIMSIVLTSTHSQSLVPVDGGIPRSLMVRCPSGLRSTPGKCVMG
jgi:hypothetical protein